MTTVLRIELELLLVLTLLSMVLLLIGFVARAYTYMRRGIRRWRIERRYDPAND